MATAILENNERTSAFHAVDDRHGWGFALLLTMVATLFVRPADLIPSLADWPIYEFLIIGCLVVSSRAVLRRLAQRQLEAQPVTACLLLLVVAVGLSHLAHGFIWGARMSMYEVCKLLAFYLLFVSLVNTQLRLVVCVKWLVFAITLVAILALLDRYELVSIAALESVSDRGFAEDGRPIPLERIRGTGIFQDPNDFGLILVVGLILSTAFLSKTNAGWPRHVWLIPSFILLFTLALTHSRGALLSLACAIPAALTYSRGWKSGLISMLGLPILAIIFSARMTDVNALNEGTGQSRIQIWSDSLSVWKQYPVFGLGEGQLVSELGVVTHNSFLHCYAELGAFGGTIFLSCFMAAVYGLWLQRVPAKNQDKRPGVYPLELRELQHLRLFVFTSLAAYIAGILTISRQFVIPTYLMLGLASSAYALPSRHTVQWTIDSRAVGAVLVGSATALAAFYVAVRIFVRW